MCSNHGHNHSAPAAPKSGDAPHVCCGRCNGEGKRLGAQAPVAIPIATIGKVEKPSAEQQKPAQ